MQRNKSLKVHIETGIQMLNKSALFVCKEMCESPNTHLCYQFKNRHFPV